MLKKSIIKSNIFLEVKPSLHKYADTFTLRKRNATALPWRSEYKKSGAFSAPLSMLFLFLLLDALVKFRICGFHIGLYPKCKYAER